jgi:tetratricopeptide (TPR) repeat protein
MPFRINAFLVVALISVSLFSCSKSASEDDSVIIEGSEFNQEEYANQFHAARDRDKWLVIERISGVKFKEVDKADAWLNQLLIEQIESNQTNDGELLYSIIMHLDENGYNNSLLTLSGFVIAAFKDGEYSELRLVAAVALGYEYAIKNDLDSLKYYLDCVAIDHYRVEDSVLLASYYSLAGNYFELSGNLFASVTHYNKALEYVDVDDITNRGTLFNNLAVLYSNMEYYEKAGTYVDQFDSVYINEPIPTSYLLTKAVIKMRLMKFEVADSIYNQLIAKGEQEKDLRLLARIYSNRGNLLRRQKRFDKAFSSIDKSDSLCLIIDSSFGLTINTINRAEINFDLKHFQEANDALEAQLPVINDINLAQITRSAYDLLYRINDSLGNTDKANHYFRLFIANKDPYIGDLPRSFIAERMLDEENKKRVEQEIKLRYQNEKTQKERLILGLVILVMLLMTLYLFYRFQNKLLIAKFKVNTTQQELELRTKELLANTFKEISINSFKHQFTKEVDALKRSMPSAQRPLFDPLLKKLEAAPRKNIFKDFDLSFTKVYEGFYEKLHELAPSLTSNEIRVCAYIKLNLSTKEICEITNRSQGTIENTRVSIRKKLHLSPEENLQCFLTSI